MKPCARRFVMLGLLVRKMELPRLKVGIVHSVQLITSYISYCIAIKAHL